MEVVFNSIDKSRFFDLKIRLPTSLQKFWTGSKRIGHNTFVDENGLPMDNLGCNFYRHARKDTKEDIFKFPSEMTAHVSETEVVWQNSVPGMTKAQTKLYLLQDTGQRVNAYVTNNLYSHLSSLFFSLDSS